MIVKKGKRFQVQSESGKNLGTYDSRKDATDRLKDVEMFKQLDTEKKKKA